MIDQTVSHYRILSELGRGGMGVVYKAHDTKLSRLAALKVLAPELLGDEEHRQRFLREARSAAAVAHPYIAAVFDAGETDGIMFIAMEFVEGKTLRALLNQHPLSISEAQQYATEIAEGLATAHQARLVHRDLKPENVMVANNGHVKILDFGLAKLWEARDEAPTMAPGEPTPVELTRYGAILGTPAYMSPEQSRGEAVDSRSDIFSFGSTIYEMVTGEPLFRRATHADTLASILRDQPLFLSELNSDVAHDFSRIIDRCLQKKPEKRYNDTRDLVAALKCIPLDSVHSKRVLTVATVRHRTWLRRFVGIASLVVLAGLALWQPWKSGSRPVGTEVSSIPTEFDRPNWILVAHFDGPVDAPTLADVARELVSTAVHRHSIATPISNSQMRRGLELAGFPDTTHVVGEIARALAFRAGAQNYIEGRVDRVASGLSVIVRVLETETGRLIGSLYERAENEDLFLQALESIGRDLPSTLGHSEQSQQFTNVTIEAITPSLEAYRLFLGAVRLRSVERRERDAQVLIRQALKLDPDFALAWKELGLTHWNLGLLDSAVVAFESALHIPDRLTVVQRLTIEARIADVAFDSDAAIQKYALVLNQDPRNFAALTNRANRYRALGRYELALNDYVRKERFEPFTPPRLVDQEYGVLLQLGRFGEAQALLPLLLPKHVEVAELMASMAQSDWAKARIVVSRIERNPAARPADRYYAGLTSASLAAAGGRLQEAIDQLRRTSNQQSTPHWQSDISINSWTAERLRPGFSAAHLALALQKDCGPMYASGVNDTTVSALILRGLCEIANGNVDTASDYTTVLQQKRPRDLRRFAGDLRLLRAWIARYDEGWNRAADVVEARPADEALPEFSGTWPLHWIVAEANERSGRLEEAILRFEKIVSFPRPMQMELFVRGLPVSFARQRLVLLYAKMGHIEDARRHWDIFREAFTNADPELSPMVEQTRQVLEEAEAKAGS